MWTPVGDEGMVVGGPWGRGEEELGPRTATTNPAATVGGMIAVKFAGGVAVLADRVTSYGKMARYKNTPRVFQIGPSTIVAVGGDVADFQLLHNRIQSILFGRQCREAGAQFPAPELHSWLTAVLYNRRSRMNPLWNSAMVLGMTTGEEKSPFLGEVNLRGVPNKGAYIATGFATYLCRQALEEAYESAKKRGSELTEKEAVELLEKCQTVMFYRDCCSYAEYDIGLINKDGAKILENRKTLGDWNNAFMTRGYE